MIRVLFVCSRNRLRSPTAEQIFADVEGVETTSAGLAPDADNPMTAELVEWADVIFVMEKIHRTRLQRRFGRWLKRTRLVCLDIPDDYGFMDDALVRLLRERVGPRLGRESRTQP